MSRIYNNVCWINDTIDARLDRYVEAIHLLHSLRFAVTYMH